MLHRNWFFSRQWLFKKDNKKIVVTFCSNCLRIRSSLNTIKGPFYLFIQRNTFNIIECSKRLPCTEVRENTHPLGLDQWKMACWVPLDVFRLEILSHPNVSITLFSRDFFSTLQQYIPACYKDAQLELGPAQFFDIGDKILGARK